MGNRGSVGSFCLYGGINNAEKAVIYRNGAGSIPAAATMELSVK